MHRIFLDNLDFDFDQNLIDDIRHIMTGSYAKPSVLKPNPGIDHDLQRFLFEFNQCVLRAKSQTEQTTVIPKPHIFFRQPELNLEWILEAGKRRVILEFTGDGTMIFGVATRASDSVSGQLTITRANVIVVLAILAAAYQGDTRSCND